MKKLPKVSIIIANYNGRKYLDRCLTSVFESSYKDYEILTVDDGSTDGSAELLEKYVEKNNKITLLKNRHNLGASASRNLAIRKAHGEIIIFLDNDTEVEKNWLFEILKPFNKDKSIGGVQSILLDFEKRELIQMAGGYLIPHAGWLLPFHQWEKYGEVKDKLKAQSIVGISAALAVRKSVVDKVNGFDEKEALYTEDLDFCWRIWVAGYRIVLAPKSIVYHWTKSVKQRSGMNANFRQIYFHMAKNSFRSIIKNYELSNVLKYLPVTILINIGRGFFYLLSRGSIASLAGSIEAFLWFVLNIQETLKARRRVQSTRKVSDGYLLKEIFTSKSLPQIYNEFFR